MPFCFSVFRFGLSIPSLFGFTLSNRLTAVYLIKTFRRKTYLTIAWHWSPLRQKWVLYTSRDASDTVEQLYLWQSTALKKIWAHSVTGYCAMRAFLAAPVPSYGPTSRSHSFYLILFSGWPPGPSSGQLGKGAPFFLWLMKPTPCVS